MTTTHTHTPLIVNWLYTDKHGSHLTGTLEEIGTLLIDGGQIGADHSIKYHGYGLGRLTDNPQPWVTLVENVEGDVTEAPQDFTTEDWIEWAGAVEDRDGREVRDALSPKGIPPVEPATANLIYDTAEIAAPRDEVGIYRRFSVTDTVSGRTLEYATNRGHDGLWIRTRDGFDQIAGTSQASIETEADAVRFLRERADRVWGAR